ncbi:MAG: hypothetical protein AAB953_00885 [Patescibacteria group bacterium]
MAETNLANLEDTDSQEQPDRPDQKLKQADQFDEKKWTPNEIRDLKEGHKSLNQLFSERKQLKAEADIMLKDLATGEADKDPIIKLKEYRDLSRELEETESPEKTKAIIERLRALPNQKQEAAQKEKDEAEKRDPEAPELLKLEKKFEEICDDNAELIGEKQIPGFKAWIKAERQKNPTIKHLKEQIAKLEGKEMEDRNGLSPRRAEYAKLQALFKKYGISSPQECDYIRMEGLSERQAFRKKIEETEKHFDTVKDTGFYSREVIQKMMRESLLAQNPTVLDANLKQAKDIARKESESYTYLDSKISIGEVTILKMSEASKQKYLQYYRNTNFKERSNLVSKWPELVENEAKLTKQLEKIYGDDKERLKLALGSFAELDFLQKEAALKTHKKLVEGTENKEERDRTLIIAAANTQLEKAAGKNAISKRTLEKYKAFFQNENNFKNPETHASGDIKQMKKAYEILVSPTPNEGYKNLAAYESRRKAFQKDLSKLQELNSSISDEEIKEWQNRYDDEGWTKRAVIHKQDLVRRIAKEQSEGTHRRELEKKAGIKEKDKKEAKENSPKLAETLEAVTKLLGNNQGAEAMKLLLEFNETEPDNAKVLFWMKVTADYMKEFGSGKKREKTVEKELERELDEMAQGDEMLRDELTEQQLKTLNIEGAKQSEQRHDKKTSAHERAKEESMGKMQEGSVEADLTMDAYEQLGDEYIIDKETKAEKIQTVDFKETGINDQDKEKLKRKTYQEQSKLDTKEGFMREIEDKSGRKIKSEEAKVLQKEELEKIEERMAQEAEQKVSERTTGQTQGAKIFDLTAKMAARRKAGELVDKKRYEKLKTA